MINTLTRTVLAAVGLAAIGACQDTAVPNFRSPQINAETPAGIQYLVTGVVANSRTDLGQDIVSLSGFDRDMGVFTAVDSRFITELMGDGNTIPNSDFYGEGGWSVEFANAKDAEAIIQDLPKVSPAYSASDASLIAGVMKTFEAYNMLLVAETRDTLGVPIFGFVATAANPAPFLCIRDVWKGIAAMLDSAEADLDAGKPGPLPITLPPGFGTANQAGPSGTAGTFAGLNRALAAYAKFQYAYGATRVAGGTPATVSTPGSPLASALTSADSAVHASWMYNPGALTPPSAGDFSDPMAVYHNFSSTSGDADNPVTFSVGQTTTLFVLDTVAAEIAAGGDLRANKLMTNTQAPNSAAGPAANAQVANMVTVGFYETASSPIPIIRDEELVLIEAAIQLGEGNLSNAIASINAIRSNVGKVAIYNPATPSYVGVRDQLLHEMRASNIGEPGEERLMAVRNYGLQMPQTQTWGKTDLHTTLLPVPIQESGPRNGAIAPACQ
jgi:hypothetical protein